MRDKTLELYNVRGEDNPAGFSTTYLSSTERINNLFRLFGCVHRTGRCELAPKLRKEAATSKGEGLVNVIECCGDTIALEKWTFPAVCYEWGC